MKSEYTDNFFNISAQYGFLPIHEPLNQLPERYSGVQNIIDRMPVNLEDGSSGLLAKDGDIEIAVRELTNYREMVVNEEDPFVLQALFRAYSFLTSGYLLSPAHHQQKDGVYGKAHQKLPRQLAQPFVLAAEKLNVYPWLDYHYAYSLGNYVKVDPNGNLHWNNLKMACSFSGTTDEMGFIMNHVYINEVSPKLIRGVLQCFNNGDMREGMNLVLTSITEMNERRKTMWKASNPKNYNDFRTFIMGIIGNEGIFGDGVVYEGVDDEPRKYRGQTGAQDDIIPTMDIFSGVVQNYPDNMLTTYLLNLRSYRPKCVQEFFDDLRKESVEHLKRVNKDRELSIVLLRIIEQIYFFRNGHWQFVQKYIMANTKYNAATGGTPITSWIPNQIEAVLKSMSDVVKVLGEPQDGETEYRRIKGSYDERVSLLYGQLDELKKADYDVERVYNLNNEKDVELKFV